MKKGFTLIELLIVLAIVGVITAALFHGLAGGEGHAEEVTDMAIDAAEELGYEDVQASCEGRDSNGDGKVSCTVSFATKTGRDSKPFLCPASWLMSSTCQQGMAVGRR